MAFYSYLSTKIIIAFITKSYQDLFGVRSYINAYFLSGISGLVMRTVKSFCTDCYYSLRQWTVQSATVDCTVCRSETYGLLS